MPRPPLPSAGVATVCAAPAARLNRRPPLLNRAASLTRSSERFSNTPIWRTSPPRPLSASATRLRLPKAHALGIGSCLVSECIGYQAAGFRLVKEEPHHSFGQYLVGQYWELALPAWRPRHCSSSAARSL